MSKEYEDNRFFKTSTVPNNGDIYDKYNAAKSSTHAKYRQDKKY